MDCVQVVENLSQLEKNSILHVLQRDEQLRQGQEQKISNLKREIYQIRTYSVLRAGDDQSKICLRCRAEMGILFNRGALCPSCKYKVCKNCQEVMFNGSWLCKLCYKQRQLKWLTGEWSGSFEQNPLRKWASGSDIMRASLQLVPGTTTIDIDESPSNHGNDKQGKKVSRNGVGSAERSRTRVEAPKEGDQLKLSELFNVLRVKKPDDKQVQETQVRRVTSRKFSESDSDSSSSSDIDIKSTSTAPSVTESELDGRRVESPRGIESPQPRIVEPPVVAKVDKPSERYKAVRNEESQEYRAEHEANRPKPSPRSPKPAARRTVKSEYLEQEIHSPTAKPRAKERSGETAGVIEGQVSMSRSMEVPSSPSGRSEDNLPQSEKGSIHSELNLHVAKTKESLDKKSRSQASLDSRRLDSDSSVRPKTKEQIIRKSADNLSIESKQTKKSDQRSLNKSDIQLDRKNGAELENKRSASRSDVIKSVGSREPILVDESQMTVNQNNPEASTDRKIHSKHLVDRDPSTQLSATKEEDGFTQRAGSPYSFSMDSLPSSHPSPTLNRCSFSSNPDSDTDSVSRFKNRPNPILEQSPSSTRSADSKGEKGKDGDNVVVEEISKVKFRRVSKTVAQIGSLAKMSLSPNRNNSREVDLVVEQGETQSRVGSGLNEEGGGFQNFNTSHKTQGTDNVFDEDQKILIEEPTVEDDICIKQDVSEKVTSPKNVTELLMKKLENMSECRPDSFTENSYQSTYTENSYQRNKSVEEMMWINEDEDADGQVRPFRRLPKLMTSSVASEFDRKPSEADSIEDMIDNMARNHFFVETNVPPRASEADSYVGFNLTPMSPFPQEVYEKRSGDYNRFAYMSDDNLEGDSADDLLDDDNDDQMDSLDKLVEKNVVETEMPKKKKNELQSLDSLDLILNEQEDCVDGDQDIELENEYQNALKLSNKTDAKASEQEKSAFESRDCKIESIPCKSNSVCNVKKDYFKRKLSDDSSKTFNEEIKNTIVPQKESEKDVTEPDDLKKTKQKPKLESKTSLDILLDQQGDLVDQSSQNIELDADLLANLEQNFKEHMYVQEKHPALSKEYAYLGIYQVIPPDADRSACVSLKQDAFDTLVEHAEDFLHGKSESATLGRESRMKVKRYVKHDSSLDSSDSDMLSVIEEVDDEMSGSDGEKHTLLHEAQEDKKKCIEIIEREETQISENSNPAIEEVIVKETKPTLRTEMYQEQDMNKAMVKGKIFQKARDIEQKMKNLIKGNASPAVIANKKGNAKHLDKYKKVHDHWLALEKHEADMLDIDEIDKDPEEKDITEEEEIKTDVVNPAIEVTNEFGVNCDHPDTMQDVKTTINKQVIDDDEENEKFDDDSSKDISAVIDGTNITETQDGLKKEFIDSPDSSTFHGISNGETQTETNILNSTIKEQSNYIGASINDSNVLCHSISDISSFANSEIFDSSITSKESINMEPCHDRSITVPRDSCHSLPDIDIEQSKDSFKQGDSSDLKTSINDSRALCQSISELHEPIIESFTEETSSLCASVKGYTGDQSKDIKDDKDDVFENKVSDCSPKQRTSKERLTSDEIRIELTALQQPQKIYKTEIEFSVDKSGRVTPPATMTTDLQFFKPPEKPPRFHKTSSSSVPNSPEISSAILQVRMDSPRSEKLASARDSPRTVSECSVSQDDSGNVSGGSRGTTPEHRRTDSSYSQSSLPSTLSNATDEDDDIDNIVARVQKQTNRSSNLLSVFGDSRESLASYYSDAGDIAYSNIPITGEILFSLNYNYKTSMLEVGVKQCRNIAIADTRRRRSDPYVKTYLLPDRTRGGKRKTKVKKHSTSPTFDETLKYSLTKSELENRTLWLTVWHNDRFGRNVFLGEVTINFDYYKFEDPFPRWYPLQERMDAPPPSMMVYKGDLSICIKFVPAEKLGASPATTSKQKKEGGKGLLQVMVKEARNLTGVKSNGFSDPFCKGYLLPERHKSSKQKTSVIKKDCSPVWNHTFVFEDVTMMELRERCLELTIWDYEKLASNDFLGGVRLNLGTGVSGGKTVEWMDARGEEMSMWQAMLDRPNVWIDGALILRPNMDKRKF